MTYSFTVDADAVVGDFPFKMNPFILEENATSFFLMGTTQW
jgi:hypothetical protein